ncbi:MAG TPA: glycosyltransferase [Gemmatimonadales bacterium]|nr:glycosyltransferase [Gemmatimonadales bacterium]
MTLRVVHLASGREWRGGERQVWLLARALRRTGAVRQRAITRAGSELERRLRAEGIEVAGVRWEAGLDPRPLLHLCRRIGPDELIHAHDAHAVTLAGLAALWTRARWVASRRVVFPLRRRGLWARADRIVAVSEATRRRLLADGIAPDRVAVVHSAIPIDEVRAAAPLGVRARLGLAPHRLLAANVAALTPEKGHDTLLAAAAILAPRAPELHWALAGDGPGRPALEDEVLARGLAGRVHLLGHLPDPGRLIADADLFVFPSRAEGLGTTILEAMALGVPVVASAVGGIPELLDGDAGVLVPPDDPDALAGAIAALLADPTRRRRVAEAGRARALAFGDDRMAAATLSVYRSIVQGLDGA